MISVKDFFNENTLNVFVDGSVLHKDTGETIGAPGAIMVETDCNGCTRVTQQQSYFVRNSTNNDTEIRSIYLGIGMILNWISAYGYIPKKINLFSDSQICVKGLTEWIYNWVKCTHNDTMYSSSGEPVANQEIIKAIVYTILRNELEISIWHQKGHVTSTSKSLTKAMSTFKTSNIVKDIVDQKLIIQISEFNNYVDEFTGILLAEADNIGLFDNYLAKGVDAISFSPQKIDVKMYRQLIKRR